MVGKHNEGVLLWMNEPLFEQSPPATRFGALPLTGSLRWANRAPGQEQPCHLDKVEPTPLGTFQSRVLEWAAISFSRGSSWPRDWTRVFCIAGRRFTVWATGEALGRGEEIWGGMQWLEWVVLKSILLNTFRISVIQKHLQICHSLCIP